MATSEGSLTDPTDPLLEREREVGTLRAALRAAAEGEGRLLGIEGAAGLGKSRLVAWSKDTAAAEGFVTLAARSNEQEQGFSFGVVLQLFEGWLAAAGREARASILSGSAGLALPLLEGDHRRVPLSRLADPVYPLLHGLFWLTSNIAAREPLLITVDDLQATDLASLRFLGYLANRLEGQRVAIVVTWRSGSQRSSDEFEELVGHRDGTRLRLLPLSETAVSKLLANGFGESVDPGFSDACFSVTRGNPFFVKAVIRAVRADGMRPDKDSAAKVATLRTDDIEHQLAVRVSRLGEDATRLASAVAVLGDGVSIANAAGLSELHTDSVLRAADALSSADIFASGLPLSFSHPLTRAVVYGQIPPAQRAHAQLRAARMLETEAVDPEIVGAHLLLAPATGEEWVVSALSEAADLAWRRGSPQSAVEYLRRALREPAAAHVRGRLLLELARVEAVLGEEAAQQHAQDALGLVDGRARAEALKTLGDSFYSQGRFAKAAQAFERGLALLEDPNDPLARDLGVGYFSSASIDIALAPRVLDHISTLGGVPEGTTSAERAVLASMAVGRWVGGGARGEVVDLATRAWAGGRLLTDEGPDGWAWSLLTAVFMMTDELEAASLIADEVIEQAQRSGSLMAYATASFCASGPALRSGQIALARAHIEATLGALRDGWKTYLCAAYGSYANILVVSDEVEAAEAAVQIADQPVHAQSVERTMVLEPRGRIRLLQGRNEEALADFLEVGEILEKSAQRVSFFSWRAGAALAAHRIGDGTRARELLSADMEIAEATEIPSYVARVLRTTALVGERDEAVALLERALAVLEHSQARLEYLFALADLGAALRRAGRRGEARERLEAALDLAHRFGARLIVRQVRDELKVAGARPRHLAFSGVQALTASERRVAEMAAKPMSNRDIAQVLFVTTRAVEKHLYNSYSKLGIRTRKELAAVLGDSAP
ncbi:MAG: helix-turn-helix transcriptional regulator, partial [Acidimicrobiales bacterium]